MEGCPPSRDIIKARAGQGAIIMNNIYIPPLHPHPHTGEQDLVQGPLFMRWILEESLSSLWSGQREHQERDGESWIV